MTEKISISKLTKIWNPFEFKIWIKMETPVTEAEIVEAINNNQLIGPDSPKKMYMDFWDESTREEHVHRIAWFVKNYSHDYPLSLDFGIPNLGVGFNFDDGNHRLAAAIFLKLEYVVAEVGGSIDEIEKFIYKDKLS